MDKIDKTLKQYYTEERDLLEKTRELLDQFDSAELPDVPSDLSRKAKNLVPGGAVNVSAQCPHCGQSITPFRKALPKQMYWNALWFALACMAFIASFIMKRYFIQFVAMAVLFAIKAIVDQKAIKTQVLIYKALKEDKETGGSTRHLHKISSRL